MNGLQVFHYQDNDVRSLLLDGEPWFVLRDVCAVLSIARGARIAERLEEDEVRQAYLTDSLGRQQETTIINESGLYSVILRSDKPEAKPFRKWVTSEVLPSIRKTGSYSLVPAQPVSPQRALTTDDYIKAASIIAICRNERLPYVLGFLEQGGLSIPQLQEVRAAQLSTPDNRHTRYAKTEEDIKAQRTACDLVRSAVEEHGITLAQLSSITGIARPAIFRYKAGTHRPTPERARYLVEIITQQLPQETKDSESQ